MVDFVRWATKASKESRALGLGKEGREEGGRRRKEGDEGRKATKGGDEGR
jgi:hypothetical protein